MQRMDTYHVVSHGSQLRSRIPKKTSVGLRSYLQVVEKDLTAVTHLRFIPLYRMTRYRIANRISADHPLLSMKTVVMNTQLNPKANLPE